MKLRITEQQYRFLIESEGEEDKDENLIDFSKHISTDPDLWDEIFEQKNKLVIKNGGKKYDGYYINRDVNLRKSQIKELKYLVKVSGYLDLYKTRITELPMLSEVGGNLNLRHSPITELPLLTTVGEWLDLRHTPIGEELKKTMSDAGIKNKFGVKGKIYI